MSRTNDPVDAHLAALGASTLAAAPRALPPAVLRILAERRRAVIRSRRLLSLVAVASAAPVPIVLAAWMLRPAETNGALLAVGCVAAALVSAVGAATSAWTSRT